MRQKSTNAENILWNELRRKKLGYKFKRQFSIDNYVIDFYCPDFGLAIELDGEIHRCKKEYDNYRTKTLNAYGVTEIRFKNFEVYSQLERVLDSIKRSLTYTQPSPMLRRGKKGEVKT